MNTVVYYPYIYPSPEWLKMAALCWDKVYTLAPGQHTDSQFSIFMNALPNDAVHVPLLPDSDAPRREELAELDAAFRGILEPIPPRAVFNDELTQQFARWVKARKDELLSRHVINDEINTMYLLGGKLEPLLINLLLYLGVAELERVDKQKKKTRRYTLYDARNEIKALVESRQEIDPTLTIRLPKDIALYYLALCASTAAAQQNRDLIADGEPFTDPVFYDQRVLRGEVTTTVLRAYLPKNFNSLAPKQIAEFRDQFATQRLKFQKEVQSLCDEFSRIASEGELTNLRARIIELAKQRVEETKQTYARAKLEMGLKTFGISLAPPALATSIASALSIGIFAPAGIAAALSLVIAATLMEWDKAKKVKSQSPWSYILDSSKIK